MQSRAEARSLALRGNNHADRAGNGRGRGRGAYDGAPTPQHFSNVPIGPQAQIVRPTYDSYRPSPSPPHDFVDVINEDREQQNQGSVRMKDEPMADDMGTEALSVRGVVAASQYERRQSTMMAPPDPPAPHSSVFAPLNLTERIDEVESNFVETTDRVSAVEGQVHQLQNRAQQQQDLIQQQQDRIHQLEEDNRVLRQQVQALQNSNNRGGFTQRMSDQVNAVERRHRDLERYTYPSHARR